MAERKAAKKHKKALPTWVSVVVIVVVLAVVGVVYARIQSATPDPAKVDPTYNPAKAIFYKKLQNPAYAKILSASKRAQLAAEGRIPEAWGAVPPDYSVPWDQAKNAADSIQFIEKWGEKE
jgi:hypothetical protein